MGRRTKEQTKVDETIIRKNAGGEGNETKLVFATRLNDLIDQQGLRQSDLSKMTGIATGTISGYRNGDKEPTITNLRKIAQALDVSADYLIGLSNVRSPDIDTQAICKKIGCSEEVVENLTSLYSGEKNIGGTIFKKHKQKRVSTDFLDHFFSSRELEHFLLTLKSTVYAKNEAVILYEQAYTCNKELDDIELRLAQEVDAEVETGNIDPDEAIYILEQRCRMDITYSKMFGETSKLISNANSAREKSDAILWRSQHEFWKFIESLATGIKVRKVTHENIQTKQQKC